MALDSAWQKEHDEAKWKSQTQEMRKRFDEKFHYWFENEFGIQQPAGYIKDFIEEELKRHAQI